MRQKLSCLLASLAFAPIFAQKPLPPTIILEKTAAQPEQQAAKILQFYLQKMTATEVKIQQTDSPPDDQANIFIYKDFLKNAPQPAVSPEARLEADAFFIQSNSKNAVLVGGGGMGAEYAVYTFLEHLGCRKFTPRDSLIPKIENFRLPEIAPRVERPAFAYRELHFPNPIFDENFARWHKLKTRPAKESEWGMFVHTFEKLLPPSEHFASHPEFFSWNGKQFSRGQICLSNDTVRQTVIQNLGKMMAARPAARIWSVSQNDNFDYCRCARCAASDSKFGSPAGTLLAFVNSVAAAFPDKIISTLAYQYTRQAPVGIVPAANVSVCLCSIECNRGLPLVDDPSSAGFVRDVEQWSKLSKNLMIWDYVVQFRDYLSPFPIWHTLQPNLQFFQKNGVEMMFEQGSGSSRSEFSDMKTYLLAKLMWNPQADMDSILTDFGEKFYGRLKPIVWQYIDTLTTRLLATDRQLQIYGTPLTPARSWMTERDVAAYFSILEKGVEMMTSEIAPTQATEREAQQLSEIMLPMIHTLLEQFKIRDWGFPERDTARGRDKFRFSYLPAHHNMINGWADLCRQHGYETMNENNFSPEAYAEEMRQFFAKGRVWHSFQIVRGETVRGETSASPSIFLEKPASKNYADGTAETLIDSRRGTTDFRFSWLGFEGEDLVATLRQPDALADSLLPEVSVLSVQFLQDQQAWVFFPQRVVFEVSEDGQNFQTVRDEQISIVADGRRSVRKVQVNFSEKRKLRAVRVAAFNQKTCPAWHSCVGNRCWIFADEIVVD